MTDTLVIQTAWLGDALLTTPLLRALAARHGPLDVLTTPDAAPLLETHPAVADVLAFDKRGADRGLRGLARWARRLRRRSYRRAYLAQSSWRSAGLALLAGVPERIGFDDAPARRLYTRQVPRHGPHESDRLACLAGTRPADTPLTLVLTDADMAAARAALGAGGVTGPYAVIAPGSARATKRWPHYPALGLRLSERGRVVVVGAAADIMASAPLPLCPPALDLRGRVPIRVSAAVIALADVAVTNDSAALHMAQAVGTPVVALFGPTTPALGFGPRGRRDEALGIALPCRPCSPHGGPRCPLDHHRCMRELSLDTVLAAVVRARVPTSAATGRPSTVNASAGNGQRPCA